MRRVDLNADLGESFGHYRIGQDEELLPLISSANIACGYHAGDPNVMARAVEAALARGVAVGAHPGLPDLAGFGRREMQVTASEVYALVLYQAGALEAFVRRHGRTLRHVKPHGALYHMAERQPDLAQAIAQAAHDFDPKLILYGLAGGRLVRAGREAGLRVVNEVFADRTYQADGTLTPRTSPQALIHDPVAAAERMARLLTDGAIAAVDGTEIRIPADTICLHGDGPEAVAMARQLRQTLAERGFLIGCPGEP